MISSVIEFVKSFLLCVTYLVLKLIEIFVIVFFRPIHKLKWNVVVKKGRVRYKVRTPKNTWFLADPFIHQINGVVYAFMERFDKKLGRGVIAFSSTLTGFSALEDCLIEDNHLSFPFLVESEGKIFMIPESHEDNSIRVFENLDFPAKWGCVNTIMSGISAVDSMVFYKNGYWWLLTNIDPSGEGDHGELLYVYYSDKLLSKEWKAHDCNPVRIGSNLARNAGLLIFNNKFVRVAQVQGYRKYGHRVQFYAIEKISPHEYVEKLIPNPVDLPRDTMHHHVSISGECYAYDCFE